MKNYKFKFDRDLGLRKLYDFKHYLEELTLLNLYINPNLIEQYAMILTPNDFRQPTFSKIYSDALKVYRDNNNIAMLFLFPEAREQFEKKAQSLSPLDLEYDAHIRLVHVNYLTNLVERMLELININHELTDPVDIIWEIFREAENALSKVSSVRLEKLSDLIQQFNEIIKNRQKSIATLYTEIDNSLQGGLQPGDLVLIGARPRMGKTTFACQLAYNIAKQKKRVNFYSLELDKFQILSKIIAFAKGCQISSLRFYDIDEMQEVIKPLDSFLYIVDYLFSEKDILNHIKETHPNVAIIDYLQLVKIREYNITRDRALTLLTEVLKRVAKQHEIGIIGLTQLKRRAEETSEIYPKLSDLRESGGLEATADVVIMIDRPELRGILTDEDGQSTKGVGYFVIAKNRRGSEYKFKYRIVNSFFYPFEEEKVEQPQF